MVLTGHYCFHDFHSVIYIYGHLAFHSSQELHWVLNLIEFIATSVLVGIVGQLVGLSMCLATS